jgi:hypothetical protein
MLANFASLALFVSAALAAPHKAASPVISAYVFSSDDFHVHRYK